jgi:hypothetical protein
MSLATGKRISRRRWTELPFTQEVIDRVNAIALMEATYDADVPDFQFAWGNNDPIEDLDEDEDDHINEVNVFDDDDNDDDGGDRPLPLGTETVEQIQEEVGAFDAKEVALDAQEEGALGAQEEDELAAQEAGAYDALDEEEVFDTENEIEAGVETGTTEEVQNTPHYNLRGNKVDYTYMFAFTQLADIKVEAPTSNIEVDLRNHIAATGFSLTKWE